ncbi:MAG: right-handed parallel beta-helix repeat-containing protein [Verrucomicrobia bacterium]|nr:right-handed parallel beta-helix repeat-containing protein [Verrucomicrobiota bacterium]
MSPFPSPFARKCFILPLLVSILLLGLWMPEANAANILFVNQNAPLSSLRNGTSWANAYTDLAVAISNANPTASNPVQIWVATGTYKPTTGTNRNASFVLKSNLAILGSFAGTETTEKQRLFNKNWTVLSGDIGVPQTNSIRHSLGLDTRIETKDGQIFNGVLERENSTEIVLRIEGRDTTILKANIADRSSLVFGETFTRHLIIADLAPDWNDMGFLDNCYNVVTATNLDHARLDKVIIAGGFANGVPPQTATSEIASNVVDLALMIEGMSYPDQTDTANLLTGKPITPVSRMVAGGGVFISGNGDKIGMILNQCTIIGNAASAYGGGIAADNTIVIAFNVDFKANQATLEGGGYWGQNQLMQMAGGTFYGNGARSGGGIHLQSWPSTNTILPTLTTDALFKSRTGKSRIAFHQELTSELAMFKMSGAMSAVRVEMEEMEGAGVGPWKDVATVAGFFGRTGYTYLDQADTFAEFSIRRGWAATSGVNSFSKISGGYAVLSVGLDAVNLGFELAKMFGTSPNNIHVKNWNLFYTNFQKYATPMGWGMQLADLIFDTFYDFPKRPPYTQEVLDKKGWERLRYNASAEQNIIDCKFIRNRADNGGAILAIFENLQVERCGFEENLAAAEGGAVYQGGYNTASILNCAFIENQAGSGDSAIANSAKTVASIVNCTFWKNRSKSTEGYAIGNHTGAAVDISNSILWDNNHGTSSGGGADVYTATVASVRALAVQRGYTNDVRTLDNLGMYFYETAATCEISHSCVQSLRSIPIGTAYFASWATTYETIQEEIKLENWADARGLLWFYRFYNGGQGVRPNLLKNGNTDLNPGLYLDEEIYGSTLQQLSFEIPSVALNSGRQLRLRTSQPVNWDFHGKPRISGSEIDMGCIENTNAVTTLYVRTSAPGSDGSGVNWKNAMTNLQSALNAGVVVFVESGTYKPPGNNPVNRFVLRNGCKIYGGFSVSAGATNFAQRDFSKYETIISGDIGTPSYDGDNSFTLLSAEDVDGPQNDISEGRRVTFIDGLTFTKARSPLRPGVTDAAIVATRSGFELRNCSFIDNISQGSGAALRSSGTVYGPVLTNCVFINNHSEGSGGALFYRSRLWAWNCRFENNSAGESGGAVWLESAFGTFWNSLFANNVAGKLSPYGNGGAIHVSEAALTLYNCTIVQNTVLLNTATPRGGGGVYFANFQDPQFFSAKDCIFWNNRVRNSTASLERQQFHYANAARSLYWVSDSIWEGVSPPARFDADPGNLDFDPQFVDAARDNFRLRPFSPAIDAGKRPANQIDPKYDLDGLPRTANLAMDLGAYEFQDLPVIISADLQLTRDCTADGPIIQLAYIGTNNLSLSFQWELNRNDGAGFMPVTESALYTGTTSTNLTILYPGIELNGQRYRVRATGNFAFTSGSAHLFVNPSRFYVNAAATGMGTGLDWANAYRTLHEAQDVIMDRYSELVCAQVWVAAGTYFPTADGNTNSYLRLRSNVAIYGGFTGTETNLSQRNPRANPTIISGNLGNPSSTADNSLFLFSVSGNQRGFQSDQTAILDGFILRDAQYSAFDVSDASPTISNCDFINNNGSHGAAVHSRRAAPTFVNCRFTDNVSGTGAFYSQDSTNVLVNSLFARNYGSHLGGAISGYRSTFLLQNCILADNYAATSGGGLYVRQGNYILNNCIIWSNSDGGRYNSSQYRAQLFNEGEAALFVISNSIVQALPLPHANGNTAFDPLFAGASTNNYRLSAHSPAIDAGNASFPAGVTNDLNDQPRVVGNSIDVGPYEFQGTPATAVQIFTLPQSVTTCVGAGPVNFRVSGPDNATLIYDWQANSGSGFVAISNDATYTISFSSSNSTLTIAAPTLALSQTSYRISIRDSDYVTPAALLTVNPPSILYVRDGAAGTKNGSSWANAFTNLQDALEIATSCNEIWVAQGTYSARPLLGANYFEFRSRVPVYGGFAGVETLRSQRNWTNYPAVLVARPNESLFEARGDLAVIDEGSILDGFTLRSADPVTLIRLRQASPTIRNCIFDGPAGTALDVTFSSPTLTDCVFRNAGMTAVHSTGSSPRFMDCLFTGNTNGAIYLSSSSPIIDRCRFESNHGYSGSALYISGESQPLITRSVFLGNRGSSGGPVANLGTGIVQFENCLFAENQSDHLGAVFLQSLGELRLINCTIANNRGARGGALFVFGGEVSSVNTIFWNNSVQDRTFIPNRELQQIERSSGVPASALHITNSCIDGLSTYAGNNNSRNDPLFVNPGALNFQLGSASPVVNAGNNAAASALASDLAGDARIFDSIVDLGAYERQSAGGMVVWLLSAPQAQVNCAGDSATFFAALAAGETNVLQWQVSTGGAFSAVPNDGAHYVLVSNGVSTLTVSNISIAMNGHAYRIFVAAANYASLPVTLSVSQPTVIYVNAAATGGNNGTSWVAAFTNLQSALAIADQCSEIWVAQGTYPATQAADGSFYFSLKPGLEIYGGFQGNELVRSARNPAFYKSILTGHPDAQAVFVNRGIDWNAAIDATSLLDGFVIQPVNGDGIFNFRASPAIRNCTIQNSTGAGIFNEVASSPTISGCVFTNNLSGALVNRNGSSPDVSDSLFVNNQNTLVGGGAIANLWESHATISNCVFLANTAPWGAAIYNVESSPAIRRSRFENNVATYDGGGIATMSGAPVLEQLVLTGNHASRGGAISHFGTAVDLVNCTISGNHASTRSGGLFLSGSGAIRVLNSLLWNNRSDPVYDTLEDSQLGPFDRTFAVSNSCIQGLSIYTGNGNLGVDPLFLNASAGDVRLSPHSPAINAGNSNYVSMAMTSDVAGNPRIVGGMVDIGAHESQTAATPVTIYSMPQSASACAASPALFSVSGEPTGSSYLWQVNTGSGFADVVVGSDYQVAVGTNDSVLTIVSPQPQTNYQVRFRVDGTAFVSVPVSLQVGSAQVWYVNASATNGPGDGTSWANAFTNMHHALELVPGCSELWVTGGDYEIALEETLKLRSTVAVYGGFAGNETERDQRNWSNNVSRLVSVGSGIFRTRGSLTPADRTAILDGFVLDSNGSSAPAIWNIDASPTIRNCTLMGNGVAAVVNDRGHPRLIDCVFRRNAGRAVTTFNGSVTLEGCLFEENGRAEQLYGPVSTFGSTAFIHKSTFRTNSARQGGAIAALQGSTLVVDQCWFENNLATAEGGAIFVDSSTLSVRNSVAVNNRSQGRGGAFAQYGGTLELVHCTVAQNSASIEGAGVYAQSSTNQVRNSIVWGNRVNSSAKSMEQMQWEQYRGTVLASWTTIEGYASFPGIGSSAADPLFANPAVNDFSLGNFSPAIDSAFDSEQLAGAFDFAGQPRRMGLGLDRGALERGAPSDGVVRFLAQPESRNVCAGNPARFDLVFAETFSAAVQWQKFGTDGYGPIGTGPDYMIVTNGSTNSLVISQASTAMDGDQFRFVIPELGYTSREFSLQVASPSVIYVNGNVVASGAGSSWGTALSTLQEAVALWNPCSEIWVAAGTYAQTNSTGSPVTLRLQSAMRIYGGFTGVEILRSERDWTNNISRLSATGLQPIFENRGTLQLVDRLAVLDGFTVSGSKATAIANYLASPTIRNCTFENNAVAIANADSSNPSIENCVFRYHTNSFGGAIYSHRSSPRIEASTFKSNRSRERGGALLFVDGNPEVIGCTFEDNRSDKFGGAIFYEGTGHLAIARCYFVDNSAADWGGALAFSGSSGTVSDSLFAGNRSEYRAGAIAVLSAGLSLRHCTLVENEAAWSGGAIQSYEQMTVVNSILWGNRQGNKLPGLEPAQVTFSATAIPAITNSVIEGLGTFPGNGNQGVNPLFIDAPARNFRLSPFSPAVNSGTISGGVNDGLDLDGLPRVADGAVDRGAYEQSIGAIAPLQFSALPQSTSACSGEPAAFTMVVVGAANPAISYHWLVNTGTGWGGAPIGDGVHTVAATANSSTLIISAASPAMNGWQYAFFASSSEFAEPYISPAATLTVSIPGVLFVKRDAAGDNSGASWANAFTNLSGALQAANGCSEIWVASGTYLPPASGAVAMKDGLEIYGGFSGNETQRSQRNWTNNPTVLSGNNTTAYLVNSGFLAPISSSAVLDGFTITGTGVTAGMVINQASPTIRNCRFAGNRLFAVFVTADSSPTFEDCVFEGNGFGAMDIRNNSAVSIARSLFARNTTENQGGALSVWDSSVVVDRSRFETNSAGYGGGAIFLNEGGRLTARHSVFVGNSAGTDGAAIFAMPTALGVTMTNCLVAHGSAFVGGGISSYAPLTLVNCTVAANTAYSRGSGLFISGTSASVLNSILWGNSDTYEANGNMELAQLAKPGATVSLNYSLLQGLATYGGNNNVPYDPLFIDAAGGNFRLQEPFSPAISVGNDAFIAGIATDLDNNPRIRVTTTVDLGAYETLTLDPLPVRILSQPLSAVACDGDTVAFSVTGASGTWSGYTWESKAPGGSYQPVTADSRYSISASSAASTLTVKNIDGSLNGFLYRSRVQRGAGFYYTDAAALTVQNPRVIFVNATAPPDGDGENWATAYNSLSTALDAASLCRPEIWVAAGTYLPTTGTDPLESFDIRNGVRVYGGFSGNETDLNQRNPQTNTVILSGDIGAPGDPSDNSHYVVLIDGLANPVGRSTLLDGVTVREARTGGIQVFHASPTIRSCVVQSNHGFGLGITGGGPLIERSSFLRNNGKGGASVTDAVGAAFLNCRFSGNTATNFGGGLNFANSSVALTNCLVSGNTAQSGAGVGSVGGSGSMVNCTIVGNASVASPGAGLWAFSGNWTVRNSILWGNRAGTLENEAAQLSFSGSYSVNHTAIQGLSNFGYDANQGADPDFTAPVLATVAPTLDGNYTLQKCSALLDDADAGVLAGITTDLAGRPRQFNGPDLGAYELQELGGDPVQITSQPANVTFCAAEANFFEVAASNPAPLTYQWEMWSPGSNTFLTLSNSAVFSGVNTARLDIQSPTPDLNGAQFRVSITSGFGCSAVSQAAQLAVPPAQTYVHAGAAPGGDGASWATAYNDLRAAIEATCSSEIWVAQGTYSASESFELRNGVAIYGGFAGTETNRSQRDWIAHPTKLSRKNYYTIVIQPYDSPITSSARLDGFIIDGSDGTKGILIDGEEAPASPVFANCVFKNIQHGGNVDSGAVENRGGGSPAFEDCTFDTNAAKYGGGAISSSGGTVTINRCLFRANRTTWPFSSGGAVSGSSSTLHIANSLFSGNQADRDGSAIYSYGELVLRNCTIAGNRSLRAAAAISADGPVTLINSIVWGNQSPANSLYDEQIETWDAVRFTNSIVQGYHPGEQTWVDGNGISADPLFLAAVNASSAPTIAGDYRVASCSPAIDSGLDSEVAGSLDLARNARVVGGAVDMGAYEAQLGSGLFILAQPVDVTANGAPSVEFSVVVNPVNVTYQWQWKSNEVFIDLTNNTVYLGATTATLTLTNLSPALDNTEYSCRIQDAYGCVIVSWTARLTLQGESELVTLPASNIKPNTAQLNASINPNGKPLDWYFEYGTSTSYGNFTTTNSLVATNSAIPVSHPVLGLIPGTLYHFRVGTISEQGVVFGGDASFATTTLPPLNIDPVSPVVVSGQLSFEFSSVPGSTFTILGTTDTALPISEWSVLGNAIEIAPGQFHFTDSGGTNHTLRFYRLRSP